MLSAYFKAASSVERVSSGVCGPWASGFADWLRQAGYLPGTIRRHLVAVAHFSTWAVKPGLNAQKLDEKAVAGFGHHFGRCRCKGFRRQGRAQGVGRCVAIARSFIDYLRLLGVVSGHESAPASQTCEPGLLAEFWRWMVQNRGVTERTLESYSYAIRELFESLGEDPSRYDARGLRQFVRDDLRHGNATAVSAPADVSSVSQ